MGSSSVIIGLLEECSNFKSLALPFWPFAFTTLFMFVNELDEGVCFKSTADLLPNRLRGLEQREKEDEFYVSIKCNCSFGDLVASP